VRAGRGAMQRRSIDDYIFFGTALRYLQDAKAGWKLAGPPGQEDYFVLGNVRKLLDQVEEFELHVTSRASWSVRQLLADLEKLPGDHGITEDEAHRLRDAVERLRPTLMAEARGNVAFIVTDKRMDVRKLLDDVAGLFAPGVFSKLPEIAMHDFAECGKCVAFERPTAAAFHCLRATEAVLRHYYCSLVRRGRAQLLWGPMVNSLARSRKKPPAVLLSNLDNIRQSFRNPTAHPEARYDISEVQDLFNLCIEAVNRMLRDLDSRGLA